jgi:uncharacterized protein (TIGR03435 family)
MIILQAYLAFPNGEAAPRHLHGAPDELIRGGPDWLDDRYTIDAKTESPQTRGMMAGPMMQGLLEDRLKLKIHRETREAPAYALVVAKGGARLQPTKGCTPGDPHGPPPPLIPGQPLPCGYDRPTEDGMEVVGWTMANLCRITGSRLGRDVIDKTGITGAFDMHLVGPGFYAPPGTHTPADPDALDAVTVYLNRLGLKLERAKARLSSS